MCFALDTISELAFFREEMRNGIGLTLTVLATTLCIRLFFRCFAPFFERNLSMFYVMLCDNTDPLTISLTVCTLLTKRSRGMLLGSLV